MIVLLPEAKIYQGFTHPKILGKKSSDILRTLRISHQKFACANPLSSKLLKQNSSYRLRHGIKKVRRYENNRKNTKETGIYQPSIQHKIGGKDSSDSSRFLRVGRGLYMGGFRRGFLLEYPKGYRILPCFSYLSDWLFLFPIHSHFLITYNHEDKRIYRTDSGEIRRDLYK